MKILVFEYINAGGFGANELPASLAHEGMLMLKALLTDLLADGKHEISLMLDERCLQLPGFESITIIPVKKGDDVMLVLENTINLNDAIWVIAPESNQILFAITRLIEVSGKLLLSSASCAIATTSDKLKTFEILSAHGIATIPTESLDNSRQFFQEGMVIKPGDGAGSENCYLVNTQDDFDRLLTQIAHRQDYIIQPYVAGDTLSISALFKQGIGQLLCINRQHLEIHEHRLSLSACEVNCMSDTGNFQFLVENLAKAFPDLWGYIGIDVINHENQLIVVEINPRLTSSYPGIAKALGINIASAVMTLLDDFPVLTATQNKVVFLNLHEALK
jgi:predicted ATP-grasp superfamily ATP-dependent carboligase